MDDTSPMYGIYLLIGMGASILVLICVARWLNACKELRNAVTSDVQNLSKVGFSSWLTSNTANPCRLLAIDKDCMRLILGAGKYPPNTVGGPYHFTIETECINIVDIISSEVGVKSSGGGIFGAVPVSVGNSTLFLGGLFDTSTEAFSLRLGIRNIQHPIVSIPMPSMEIANEWHTRIQILCERAAAA
jgi:hypothetical protein